MFQARLISVPDHTFQLQHLQRKRVLRYYLPISTCLPCVMVAHTCLCALILLSLFTLGGFVSGSEYSSLTNYIYAGPKDMGNHSNWHQFFDISNSYLHRQQYIRSRKKAYFGRRALYYSNSTATT